VEGKPGEDEGAEEHYARPAGAGDLWVMTSGPIPPNPADLLASERMSALITAMKSEFDIVLVDAPPVMAVTDPLMLSTRVDGVLIVVDTGRTRRARAQGTVGRLRHVGANLLGAVLNRVPPTRRGYYSYGHYLYAEPKGSRGEKTRRGDVGRRVPAGGSSGRGRSPTRGPRWWRNLRQVASSSQAEPRTGPKSLDQWLGEFGGPEDGRREPEWRQQSGRPMFMDEEDSKRTQQVFLGDYMTPAPKGGDAEDIKRTQQVFLGDHLPPEAVDEKDIKRTQQVVLGDDLSSEPEVDGQEDGEAMVPVLLDDPPQPELEGQDDKNDEDTRVVSLDDYLAAETEAEGEEGSQVELPNESV